MKNSKLTLEDIIDINSFEKTLEYDVLQIMKNWNKESDNSFKEKSKEELKVEKIVRKIIREEINKR